MTNEQVGADSGGDRPAGTTTTAETKVKVDAATGEAVGEDSRQAEGNDGPGTPTPAKIKFTSKIRRGLALMRMVNMAAVSDDAPPHTRLFSNMTKTQEAEYNAAMAWIEQEEDWDAVSSVWAKAGGQ